jgi:hypothetical protein
LQTNQAWYAWQTLTGRRDADPSDNVACVAARVVPCKTPPDSKVRQTWVTRTASFSAGGPANEMEIQKFGFPRKFEIFADIHSAVPTISMVYESQNFDLQIFSKFLFGGNERFQ